MAAPIFFTRFAPSPTGYLHLGHVVNALYVWGIAQALGAKVVLRIEDHDQTRCKRVFEEAILQDLEWLGLKPEIGLPAEFRAGLSLYRQTDNRHLYAEALKALQEKGLVYACDCSRQKIRSRNPQLDSEELSYDGFCRNRKLPHGPGMVLRVKLPDDWIEFQDLICGHQFQHPASQCGDFVAKDRNGNWTYQFAVVVDDIRHKINLVVRGQDLLASTGRQILLQRLLGAETPPTYAHHPLLMAADGRKLSKKDFSEDIHARFIKGEPAENLIGEAAYLANLQPQKLPLTMELALNLVASQFLGFTSEDSPT